MNENLNMKVLPEGWKWVKLGDFVQVLDNFRKPINSSERQKRIAGKNEKYLYPYYGATGQVGWIDSFLTDGEFVLVGEDGAPFLDNFKGKAYKIKGKTWVNNHAHILKEIEKVSINDFILHYLNSIDYRQYVNGTTRLKLTKSNLVEIIIPTPSVSFQRVIVSKIEELFSELDIGIENLRTAQQQLKVYRQTVLDSAFKGKLTEVWRENKKELIYANSIIKQIQNEKEKVAKINGNRYQLCETITEIEYSILPQLPKFWAWVRPDDISSPEKYSIGIGPFGSNLKVSDYRKDGIPLVFVKNITRNNFSLDLKYISQDKFKELIAHSIKPLDIVITKMGDPPGDCAIYPENSPPAIITSDCLKFRIWDKFSNRKFYKYCIETDIIKKQLGLRTKGVAQKKISSTRFKTILFPFTNREEQDEIVRLIESRLSVADKLSETIAQSLQQAEGLRQSILKKAFEGKLLTEQPDVDDRAIVMEKTITQTLRKAEVLK